ncbi:phospholipid-binding lipoprotein MlaA [Prosthecobacter debontii]|uniref:Phospholipid-binding lipoprotein MlaA n=1 Tax=Prosthecobacter debontii TaxID=48467 RepID=A0A1T4YT62_9BACT|nr:VacJ family lipoprotein [Prosthecobacter debontii]SKB04942.1 phospholipid-binding lipoprotein MlaA [Prosthecobacter debontii]
MKPGTALRLLLLALAPCLSLTQCATPKSAATSSQAGIQPVSDQAAPAGDHAVDELDDYGEAAKISDPLEGMNRVTFAFNDGVYNFLLRPISKGYQIITPDPMEKGLNNFFDNVKFPVRLVNCGLQGKFKRAGQEVQKFGVNTVAGFGGFIRQSDKIPSLANVPQEDTGQTLAVWGIGHGPYLVLPIVGPSSLREAAGYAGDYMLNPVNWGFALRHDADDFAWIPGAVNTVRSLPDQLYYYDEARKNSVDPYISVRSIYVQNRDSAAKE